MSWKNPLKAALAAMPVFAVSPCANSAIITSTYYEDSQAPSCSGGECEIIFAKVPDGKTVTVDGIGCEASIPSGAIIGARLNVAVKKNIFLVGRFLPLSITLQYGKGPKFFLISSTSRMIIDEGLKPDITISADTDTTEWGVTCHVSGVVKSNP